MKLNKLATDAYNQEELEKIELKKQKANETAKTRRVISQEAQASERAHYEANPRTSQRSNKGKSSLYVDFDMR